MPKLTTDKIILTIEKRISNMQEVHNKVMAVAFMGLRPQTAYYAGAIDALKGLLEDINEGVTDE